MRVRIEASTSASRANALNIAEAFADKYTDRVGLRHGVVYVAGGVHFVAYMTKGGLIVVREDMREVSDAR